jgi:hypothetical protein
MSDWISLGLGFLSAFGFLDGSFGVTALGDNGRAVGATMLELGTIRTRTCNGLTRRSLLRIGSLGVLGGFSWADLLRLQAQGATADRARQNAVIVLWLWGGPSHIDLFDLKPAAPIEYRGPYQPISTSVPGVQVGELLPRLAQRMHQVALIRSMISGSQDHGVAGTIGLTGSMSGALDLGGNAASGSARPATGSIVARMRGFSPDQLPSYVIVGAPLRQGFKRVIGEGAGTLGARYDPFRVEYSLEDGIQIAHVQLPEGVTAQSLRSRWELMKGMDRAQQPALADRSTQSMDRYYELALSLVTSGAARQVLEVEREPRAVRETYGMTRFGQSCLLARRLVESGIPYVQVNWSTHVESHEDGGDGGWDMHDRNFQQLQDRHAWMFDAAFAALLDDLRQRGLLRSTLIVAVGEFGRTPKINNKAGRDHWPQCYSALLAGGSVRGGAVLGASDKRAEHPAHRPVTPADLGATMLHHMGIGTTQLTQLNILPQGEALHELL